MMAATEAGEGSLVRYLTKMAVEYPQSFLPLLGRVLPLELTSDPNTTIQITSVTHYVIDSKADIPAPKQIEGGTRAIENP